MGSSSHHKGCGKPSFVAPTQPHFFKTISGPAATKKLRIPRRFVKENKGSLKSRAILTVPSGLTWKVDLVKGSGKIWLDKGWKGFSDYHSLTHGYVLLFKYLGDSLFSVIIIDRSSTEINYPISSDTGETYDDLEFVGAIHKKQLPPHSQSRPQKRKRSCSGNAPGFRSKNSCFRWIMKQCHIEARNGVGLEIPSWFSKEFITNRTAQAKLSLANANGRSWKVKLDHTENMVQLTDGWSAFVKDNCLGVGDICEFQLLEGPEFALEVSISFRAGGSSHPQKPTVGPGDTNSKSSSESSSTCAHVLEKQQEEEVEKEGRDCGNDGFSCSICMEAWKNEEDHHICSLPCGHVFGFSCITKWIGRSRSYGKCPQCSRECALKDVTKLFVAWNDVKESQKKKKKEDVLHSRVTRLKKVGKWVSSSSSSSASSSSSSASSSSASDLGEVNVAEEEVRACNGENIQYEATVTTCGYIPIPKKVLTGITLNENLVLHDEEGNDWLVGVRVMIVRGYTRTRISKGFMNFRKGRGLQMGDKIVFSFPLNQGENECNVIDVKVIYKRC